MSEPADPAWDDFLREQRALGEAILHERPDTTDGDQLVALFIRWAGQEGLFSRITEQECASLARAFMAGYAHGRRGNAERSMLVDLPPGVYTVPIKGLTEPGHYTVMIAEDRRSATATRIGD